MRARVGSGYPPLPLHGAACWLGVLFMSLMNFAEEFLPAQPVWLGVGIEDPSGVVEIQVHSWGTLEKTLIYIFSHKHMHMHTRPFHHIVCSLSWDMGVAFFFIETRAWTWISTTHTILSVRDTPKPGVPVANGSVCVRMPLI